MLLNASSAVSLIDVEPTCSQRSVPRSDSGILHRRRLPSFLTSSWSKKNDNIIENLYLCQSSLQVSRAPHFHDPSFNFFLAILFSGMLYFESFQASFYPFWLHAIPTLIFSACNFVYFAAVLIFFLAFRRPFF